VTLGVTPRVDDWLRSEPMSPRKDPEARREYHREYMRKWYAANKELQLRRVRADTLRRRNSLAAWINEFKRRPCTDCGGEFPPYLMDFDHVTGDKLGDICGMRSRTVAREAILAEMDKCEVVCANCHRARTHFRRLGLSLHVNEVLQRLGAGYVSVLVY
jgi:hypothetical protein